MNPITRTVGRAAVVIAVLSFSCVLRAGEYGNAFLEIGVGARALGMGGAFCSLADDGTSFYWNPAGLSSIRRLELSGMYGNQFGTVANPLGNYHFLGVALPLAEGVVLAANWIRLAVDDIPVYSALEGRSYFDRLHDRSLRPSGEPEGTISDSEDALFFSFAKLNRYEWDLGWMYHRVRFEIPVGINLKFIRQRLGTGSSSGIGLDVGSALRVYLNDLFLSDRLGVMGVGIQLQDITRTGMNWNTKHEDSVPVNVKWGLSYTQPLPIEENYLTVSFDRDSRWKGRNHAGLEYSGFRLFQLRAGLDDGHFTGGAGIRFWVLAVDYAFLSHEFSGLHRLSCSLVF